MSIEHNIQKQLVQAQANGFQLEEQSGLVEHGPLNPQLLTVLMGALDQVNSRNFMNNTFTYDTVNRTAQVPTGKSFSERGGDIGKDKPRTLRYEIGSKGLRFNAAPSDYSGRRKAGTQELMTVADVVVGQNIKAMEGFDLEAELEMATLLTTDSNRTAGGPAEVYNFYTDIIGVSRPAKVAMNLAGAIDHVASARKQRKILEGKVAEAGLSAAGFVMVCGDNYFDARYEIEKQESLARDLKSTVDLASQAVPTIDAKGLRYDNFDSHDGITYVNYGSTILAGQKLIGDDDAYLFPVLRGDGLVKVGYAPAETMSHVNKEAQSMYSWFFEDEFQGVTAFYESNRLSMLPRPELIAHLTAGA